jgi:hypothetical protein
MVVIGQSEGRLFSKNGETVREGVAENIGGESGLGTFEG